MTSLYTESCAHEARSEDLALGAAAFGDDESERWAAEAHLAACETCQAAVAALEDERALFTARAPLLARVDAFAPRAIAVAADAAGAAGAAGAVGARGSAIHYVFAAVACAASLVLAIGGRGGEPRVHEAPRALAAEMTLAPASPAWLANDEIAACVGDEAPACTAPERPSADGREDRSAPLASLDPRPAFGGSRGSRGAGAAVPASVAACVEAASPARPASEPAASFAQAAASCTAASP